MGLQELIKKREVEQKESKELAEKFKQIKETATTPETRTVRLVYASACGCGGGGDTYIERTVPYGSSLENGDRVRSLEGGDRRIR